jgi:chemotaxis protein MotB
MTAAARVIPLTALLLGACVSQSAYEQQGQQLQAARAQAATEQAQIAKMQQEQKWVVAGDVLFPEGGYQLSPNGKQALNQYVPRLQSLQNAKVVVYGYTDNLPVGPALQRAGIANNIDLSSRRADNKSLLFDTPQGRAQNRRIEIVLEGPGA